MTIRKHKDTGYQIDIRYRDELGTKCRYRKVIPVTEEYAWQVHDLIDAYLNHKGQIPRPLRIGGNFFDYNLPEFGRSKIITTIAHLVDGYARAIEVDINRELSKTAMSQEISECRRLSSLAGDQLLHKLSSACHQLFYILKAGGKIGTEMIKPLSSTTRIHYHGSISRMCKWAIGQGHIDNNPMEGIKKPKKRRKEIYPLTPTEYNRFIQIVEEVDNYWVPMVQFLIFTGARVGEMTALRWRDVDFDEGVVHIRQSWNDKSRILKLPKNDTTRQVPLYEDSINALQRLPPPVSPDEFVFKAKKGGMATYTVVRRFFAKAVLAFGRGCRLNIKDLRHTFATMMIEETGNMTLVSQWLGHSSIDITVDTYTHLNAVGQVAKATIAKGGSSWVNRGGQIGSTEAMSDIAPDEGSSLIH